MRFRPSLALSIIAVVLLGGGILLVRAETRAPAGDWIGHDIDGLHYEVLLPDHYDVHRAYPVVLYLHQLDLGTYRDSLRRQADRWFSTAAFRSAHPCIVVVPMLDQKNDPGGVNINFGGKRTGRFGGPQTIAALKQVMQSYRADPRRVYVTGNSMGGMGAWDMLLAYNAQDGEQERIFAAGMPLAGSHRTADAELAAGQLRQVPIWAIHGALDKEVSPDWDRTMARLLSASPTFRYTEAQGLGHDVWDTYYGQPEVWNWLFAQASNVRPDG
jgi:predicted peptidase